MNFGKMIKIIREELGITQSTLCESSRISQGHLSKIEGGDQEEIKVTQLIRLVSALDSLIEKKKKKRTRIAK